MFDTILAVLPVIAAFFCGYLLKRMGYLSSDDGSTLLKVVFYVGIPALIYISIIEAELSWTLALFAAFAPLSVVLMLLVATVLRKTVMQQASIKTFAAMCIGMFIMNTGFLIPFIDQAYGTEGLARFMILDIGNAIVVFSLVYAFAVRLGKGEVKQSLIVKEVLLAPPLWAIGIALPVALLQLPTPSLVLDTAGILSDLVSPTILLALGLKFSPHILKLPYLLVGLTGRFVLGGLVGVAFVQVFQLQGLDAIIIILSSMAPIGFNSITFSDLEGLDSEFASSLVSAGLLIGIVLIPVLMVVLEGVYGV